MAVDRDRPPAPRVIQAYFPGGRPPAHLVTRAYPSPHGSRVVAAHPAKVAPRAGAPHAATVQKKSAPHAATLPNRSAPHAATLQRKGGPVPPIAQPSGAGDVHAFQTPSGFLDGAAGRAPKEMPPIVRRKMETFFGSDFSDVRVHVGPEASSIGALAFTVGSDIYFAPGQYEPESRRGQELLGHELTHVVQQREGRVANPFAKGVAVVQDFALEDEADHMGRVIASSPRPSTSYRRELASAAQRREARPREGAPKGGNAQRRGEHKLVVGAYMHEGSRELPEALAGHAFVAIEGPSGDREAFGFSPAHYGQYDPRRDLGKLTRGVEGVVHDDAAAFEKPGVKTRAYTISAEQAEAARERVDEYRSGKRHFSLNGQQCTAFAADVARAADVDETASLGGKAPREVYRKL
ncbi:eCIS core domain-containing protein [Sorangium sp. So ce1099]|uniref:eCIS core domain-containing protein n=1 Tax=Sorangium sp. So ce1099 TaxID=3133331 RepID=UPI003F5EF5C6